MISTARLFYMATWRNWLTLKRYKADFITGLFSSVLFGIGALFFALAFDRSLLERTIGTGNYSSFMVIGIAYQAWQGVALWGAAEMFRGELGSGQIDYTFTCPFSRYSYIISNIGAMALQSTLWFLPMCCVGLWFTRSTLTLGGVLFGFAATAISVASLSQMGAFFAALVLRYRQVTAIFNLLNFAFQIMTGMFVPLQLLPAVLQVTGIVALPQTFGMDLLRHYAMGTRTLMAVPHEWAILAAQLVVFSVLARLSVRWLERTAREEGLHYL